MNDVRDEIRARLPGQRITQMSRADFIETMRIFMIDAPDIDALCISKRKKDRTLARKICTIMCLPSETTVELMTSKDWDRVEFTAAPGGIIDMRALRENWEKVRR